MITLFDRLMDALVQVLNGSTPDVERSIVEGLAELDPEIAEELKSRMFEFDDIVVLEDRAIQKVLREVEMEQLALAIRFATPDAFSAITRNMSESAVSELRSTIAGADGVDIDEMSAAQAEVVEVISRLEEAGEISVDRSAG